MLVPVLTLLLAAAGCQQDARRESRGDVPARLPLASPVPTQDGDVRQAQVLLADGHAWPATRQVYRAITVPERRTPEAVLVAARAAAEWRGWTLVNALLAYEPWLDTRFGGEGRELLARAALERGDAAAAAGHAEAALRARATQGATAVRTVLLARALDRLDLRDSAAATYRRAADAIPEAREWLLLRAAGVTSDARERERLYRDVKGDVARTRVAHTEAQALERFGLHLAAAAAYEKLGDVPAAYRLRLSSDYDAPLRAGLESGLLGYIQRDATGENLSRAIEVLDNAFPTLDAASELLVARRAAARGLSARAAAGFARVPAAQLTDADALAWARALIASGRSREAARRMQQRRFGAASAAEALYVRALAEVRSGSAAAGRATLQRLIGSHASTRHAADGLYLLADLESDAGRETRARELHQRSCVHPRPGDRSDDGCFRAGILSFALGDPRRAAIAFDELPKRFPRSPEVAAATYWAGRSYQRSGNAAVARERFLTVLRREPLSYYASRAAARLDTTSWLPAAGEQVGSGPLRDVIARTVVLEQLGMDTEERYEYDALERRADSTGTVLEAGAAFTERGQAPRAVRMGRRAVTAARDADGAAGGAALDQRGYRLLYPVFHEVTLIARARQNNLDPALVAAVIRQESSWHPRALSPAGARGLMQVMPTVGEAIARSKRYPVWDVSLLFDPDVSLELGTSHLRDALRQYNNLPRALAAYNAGGSRVNRWSRRTGVSDDEMFIERIPFVETRDYVRIVLRNVEIYRSLHGLRRQVN